MPAALQTPSSGVFLRSGRHIGGNGRGNKGARGHPLTHMDDAGSASAPSVRAPRKRGRRGGGIGRADTRFVTASSLSASNPPSSSSSSAVSHSSRHRSSGGHLAFEAEPMSSPPVLSGDEEAAEDRENGLDTESFGTGPSTSPVVERRGTPPSHTPDGTAHENERDDAAAKSLQDGRFGTAVAGGRAATKAERRWGKDEEGGEGFSSEQNSEEWEGLSSPHKEGLQRGESVKKEEENRALLCHRDSDPITSTVKRLASATVSLPRAAGSANGQTTLQGRKLRNGGEDDRRGQLSEIEGKLSDNSLGASTGLSSVKSSKPLAQGSTPEGGSAVPSHSRKHHQHIVPNANRGGSSTAFVRQYHPLLMLWGHKRRGGTLLNAALCSPSQCKEFDGPEAYAMERARLFERRRERIIRAQRRDEAMLAASGDLLAIRDTPEPLKDVRDWYIYNSAGKGLTLVGSRQLQSQRSGAVAGQYGGGYAEGVRVPGSPGSYCARAQLEAVDQCFQTRHMRCRQTAEMAAGMLQEALKRCGEQSATAMASGNQQQSVLAAQAQLEYMWSLRGLIFVACHEDVVREVIRRWNLKNRLESDGDWCRARVARVLERVWWDILLGPPPSASQNGETIILTRVGLGDLRAHCTRLVEKLRDLRAIYGECLRRKQHAMAQEIEELLVRIKLSPLAAHQLPDCALSEFEEEQHQQEEEPVSGGGNEEDEDDEDQPGQEQELGHASHAHHSSDVQNAPGDKTQGPQRRQSSNRREAGNGKRNSRAVEGASYSPDGGSTSGFRGHRETTVCGSPQSDAMSTTDGGLSSPKRSREPSSPTMTTASATDGSPPSQKRRWVTRAASKRDDDRRLWASEVPAKRRVRKSAAGGVTGILAPLNASESHVLRAYNAAGGGACYPPRTHELFTLRNAQIC